MRNKYLYWIPRILGILFILFIGLFSLDVFTEGYNLPAVLLALFMHLIPSFLLIIALIIAWKKEKVGSIIFIALGIISIFFFDTYEQILSFLLISLPIILTGILFYFSSKINT